MSALAEALAPLYRGYLRRLEEMAARIGARNVLREPVARDDEQGLVRNASGSVLRFDLADSSTGETFEVHGARPRASEDDDDVEAHGNRPRAGT